MGYRHTADGRAVTERRGSIRTAATVADLQRRNLLRTKLIAYDL